MSDRAYASFNVHESAKVRLTSVGASERRRQIVELNKAVMANRGQPFPLEPKVDTDGYYHAPLWVLMQQFGHLMQAGAAIPFEDGRIWIELTADEDVDDGRRLPS